MELSTTPSAGRKVPEFSDLVLACRPRIRQVMLLGIAGSFVLAASAYFLTPATYEAKSLVRVRQHQDVVLAPQTSRADDLNFVRAQEQIALSPQVLSRALQSERLTGETNIPITNAEAVTWLSGIARVDMKTGAEVMTITVLHPSAKLAHALSHSITEAYLTEVQVRAEADRAIRREELERAAKEAESRLSDVWEQLNTVAKQVGSDNSQSLTIRDEIQLQAYRDYSQQLRAAQLRGNELERKLAEEKNKKVIAVPPPEISRIELLQQHPDTATYKQRIAEIDQHIERIREVAADPNSPRLTRLIDERQEVERAFEKFANAIAPTLVDASRAQTHRERGSSVEQLEQQIELNLAECEFLNSRMTELEGSIVRTEENNGVQLDISRHEIERQSRLADSLWQALEELKIESQSQQRVSLIELAEFPLFPNRSRQLKAATACCVAAWIFAILGIGFLEWRSCRIRTSDDVRKVLSQPTFGVIERASRDAVNSRAASTAAREAVTRFMLLNRSDNRLPSLLLTSSSNAEPRHWVSLDLARAFSDFNRKTLLIDCDIQSSKLNQILNATNLPGLRQLKNRNIRTHDLILSTSDASFDYLPIGLEEDSSWLDPKTLKLVLAEIRDQYEAIVVNGPSLYGTSEGLLTAAQTDFTLLATFANTSRWDLLAATEQMAIAAGISVFGTIINSQNGGSPSHLEVLLPLSHTRDRDKIDEAIPTIPNSDDARSIEQELRDEIADMHSKLLQPYSGSTSQKQSICGRFTP